MRRDWAIFGLLFLLPLILFWPQTIGGRTLLPTENLYQYEPFYTYREVVKAPEIPHNHLLDDLVLQNFQWKSFIRQQLAQGEIPLWNPHQFSGIPFMAAGQQSTLYPLSLIYYVMPLTAAYGWFTVVNLWLAGVFMYLYTRGIGVSRFGGALSGITYQLAGTFIASAVHPMILGAVVWLPLLLLMAEYILRRRPLFGKPATVPWMAIGALALACMVTSGHVEIMIYTLLILGYYSAARLLVEWWKARLEAGVFRQMIARGAWLTALVALGLGIGAVQLIPLYEAARSNWRAEKTDFDTVLSYAHKPRDVLQFALPNFYGSPAHHSYFDVFEMQMKPVDWTRIDPENGNSVRVVHTEWGFKNYVEGAMYLGILPLVLAGFAVGVSAFQLVSGSAGQPDQSEAGADTQIRPYTPPQIRAIYAALTAASLTFMFGLPTYALLYVLPGVNQLNSPFRWIFGVTVSAAVLAGIGADELARRPKAGRSLGFGLIVVGMLVLVGLLVSRAFWQQIEPLVERVRLGMAGASNAFETAAMFYSYEFVNVLIFAIVTVLSGFACVWLARDEDTTSKRWLQVGQGFALILAAADLMIASWGFNPASDPLLLDFTPPAIQWLQEQQKLAAESGQAWRYAVLNGGRRDILRANVSMRYGLDDITGYESIISGQYVDYMRGLKDQDQLIYNRIAPLFTWDNEGDFVNLLLSERFKRLNVRYLVTHKSVEFPEDLTTSSDPRRFSPAVVLAYEDEAVRIWTLPTVPRAYTLISTDIFPNALEADAPLVVDPVTITANTGREKFIDVTPYNPTWLVVSESYAQGWKAFIRPHGAGEDQEKELPVELVQENFQGVFLPETGNWTVRMIYSPVSFQVGVFGTVISGAVLVLAVAAWFWQTFVVRGDGEEVSTTSRLARNSFAPIMLNLFNRCIDFVFTSVMFRILGPEDAGFYYYAIVVFGWFDIFTNFGLDLFLMREAGRQRDRAGYLFFNTTALRLLLVGAAIPLLMVFLLVRQTAAAPLNREVLLTIALFYVGLIPGSLSKGLTALFYAFERAEYPAAITTITTICKVTFGLAMLLVGAGIVGLAAVSIVTNLVTLAILYYGGRKLVGQIQSVRPDVSLMRSMAGGSWPLMLNHFLATIFFQIDIVILEWIRDARTVGLYRVAYSWLLAINVVPAFFTQALMPIMSRQAHEDRAALKRTYTLAIKLLVMTALPLAVAFTFLAEPLTWVLGGSAYLPDGAIALQIMIWSIPIGWMNSLTQYALVALDLQRRITTAFIIAVVFNLTTNLIFIPQYGFQAAAITTILSELVLWIPFAVLMQRGVGRLNWLDILWRPVNAALLMFLTLLIGWLIQPLLALILGSVIYLGVVLVLRPFNAEELRMLSPVIPARFRRLVGAI